MTYHNETKFIYTYSDGGRYLVSLFIDTQRLSEFYKFATKGYDPKEVILKQFKPEGENVSISTLANGLIDAWGKYGLMRTEVFDFNKGCGIVAYYNPPIAQTEPKKATPTKKA